MTVHRWSLPVRPSPEAAHHPQGFVHLVHDVDHLQPWRRIASP